MAYKHLPSLAGGLNTHVSAGMIGDSESPALSNISLDKKKVNVDTGYSVFGGAVRGFPQKIIEFLKTTGSSELLLITSLTFYKWVANEWQFVSNGTSTTATGAQAGPVANFVVGDSTGFQVGEYAGVTLDDGTQFRDVIGAIPDGTHITFDTGTIAGQDVDNGAPIEEAALFIGTEVDQVTYVIWPAENKVIFTNGNDQVKVYDTSTVEDLAGLPGGDTVARSLFIHTNHLCLLGTIESGVRYPQRVRWSNTADTEEWVTGNAGFLDLLEEENWLQSALKLGPYQILYKDAAIYRMAYVGSEDQLFDIQRMVSGDGMVAVNAGVGLKTYHLIMDSTKIFRYDGGFSIDDISPKIFSDFFSKDGDTNTSKLGLSFALLVSELDEAWFVLPSASEDEPNTVIKYSIVEKKWSVRTLTHNVLGFGTYRLQTAKTWAELEGSWVEQQWEWSSKSLAVGAPTILLCGHEPKQIYEYDFVSATDGGTSIPFSLETKDFDSPTAKLRLDMIEFVTKGESVIIEASVDRGVTWATLETVSLTGTYSRYRVFKQFVGITARYRFSGVGGGFSLIWAGVLFNEESGW